MIAVDVLVIILTGFGIFNCEQGKTQVVTFGSCADPGKFCEVGLEINFFRVFFCCIKGIILGFSPFQEFIRYLQNKSGLKITRPIYNTTKIVLSHQTNEVMVRFDFDGRENAELCIIWTFYCPYLASKLSYPAIIVWLMTSLYFSFDFCMSNINDYIVT